MKDELQTTNNQLSIKETDKFIFKCGSQETELDAREYLLVNKLLQGIMTGQVNSHSFYRCKRTGETFNLAHFSYLIRKKQNEPKIFGEDIKL